MPSTTAVCALLTCSQHLHTNQKCHSNVYTQDTEYGYRYEQHTTIILFFHVKIIQPFPKSTKIPPTSTQQLPTGFRTDLPSLRKISLLLHTRSYRRDSKAVSQTYGKSSYYYTPHCRRGFAPAPHLYEKCPYFYTPVVTNRVPNCYVPVVSWFHERPGQHPKNRANEKHRKPPRVITFYLPSISANANACASLGV